MNLQLYKEKLISSEIFKDFIKENPEAYLFSVFIILDKEENNNKIHFNYFLKNENKIIGFQIGSEIQKVPIEKVDEKIPEEVSNDLIDRVNLSNVEQLILREMQKNGIEKKVRKIILTLQKSGNKNLLFGNVFIFPTSMLNITINIDENKIIFFEKKSLSDIVSVLRKNN